MNDSVSVIIPVYNVELYLERCLESVINQTYKKLEIIIINDGSTDGSTEICRKWEKSDKRITLIETENRGLGPARNLGIARASGEYVAFIDSDDWWEKDALEELIKAATENVADIVYMNFYFSGLDDASGKFKEREFVQYCLFDGVTSIEETPELLFQSDARMWSKLFRRSLFTDNGIKMPAHPYEDFPVVPLLLLKAKRICQVHKPLYHYFYTRSGNLSGNVENYKYIACGIKELCQDFEKEGYMEKYGGRLSDYIFKLSKDTIDDVFFKFADKDRYQSFADEFWRILKERCPQKIVFKDKKVFLCGCRSSELICKSFIFEEQIVGRCRIEAEEIQHSRMDRLLEADYIFLDLLEDDSLAYDVQYLKDKTDRILEIIKRYGLAKNIIMVKLYYVEKYGVHKNMCQPYKNLEEIRKINAALQICYMRLENVFGEKLKVVVDFDEIPNYTYEYTKNGCFPWYYHGIFHVKAADKLRKRLVDRE